MVDGEFGLRREILLLATREHFIQKSQFLFFGHFSFRMANNNELEHVDGNVTATFGKRVDQPKIVGDVLLLDLDYTLNDEMADLEEVKLLVFIILSFLLLLLDVSTTHDLMECVLEADVREILIVKGSDDL